MLWLGIHLPLLPLEVFEETSTPVAICDDKNIVVANHTASEQGVVPGLKKSTALSLCGQLQLKLRDLQKEQSLLNQLAGLAYQFSDQVIPYSNRQQQYSLLVEVAGSARLFDGLPALVQCIQQTLSKKDKWGQNPLMQRVPDDSQRQPVLKGSDPIYPRFSYCMALADTSKAAEVKARCPENLSVLTEDQNSDAIPIDHTHTGLIDADLIDKKIAIDINALPITYLDCSEKIIRQCEDMGLNSIGAVLALPIAALRKRFDTEFTDYLEQLVGTKKDTSHFFIPPSFFKQECFFIDGLRSHDDMQAPIQQLLNALCHYLQLRQQQCLELNWLFTRFSRKKHRLPLRFSGPQHQYEQLLALTNLQLDQIPMDSPVESVQLTVKKFSRIKHHNQDFFSQQNQRGNALYLADTLRGKLGEQAVYALHYSNRILPEERNQRGPVRTNNARTRNETPAKTSQQDQPAWLFEPPQKLLKKHHQLYHGHHTITLIRGPERIETSWWEQNTCRDYYIAMLKEPNDKTVSQLCKIFYNPADRQWYLHGLYA